MYLRVTAALAVLAYLSFGTISAEAATRTGYILIDADSGRRLAVHSENEPFMTASTMKLVTALSALDRLGPDHKFETSLSTTGKLNDNVLEGDLVLHGQGDVELDLDDIMSMVLTLRQSGIGEVTGRFLVSDGSFPRIAVINPNQPVDAPYNAGVGPLSLAFGRVTMRPRGDGSYFANPELVERGPAWRIVSGLKNVRAHAVPVRDVGMHTARTLRRMAREMGIDLPIPTRGTPQAQPRKLAVVDSKPLADMVEGMMVYSNNQLAETIGLATATALKLQPKDLAESANGLWNDLVSRLPETDWHGFQITNHSGLDPNARATPAQLSALLQYGLERHALPHVLPANAWSGSLSKRLVEPGKLQRVWAKTGSLDFATALAGYLLPEGGGLWIFAIMSDEPDKRAAYDGMPEPSAAIRKEAEDWENTIKAQHDNLLRLWISQQF